MQTSRANLIRVRVYDVLSELIADSERSIELFFALEDVPLMIVDYIKYVCRFQSSKYEGHAEAFRAFMDLLMRFAVYDFRLMKELVFDQCKFVTHIAPIMLDSDNLIKKEG